MTYLDATGFDDLRPGDQVVLPYEDQMVTLVCENNDPFNAVTEDGNLVGKVLLRVSGRRPLTSEEKFAARMRNQLAEQVARQIKEGK